MALDGPATSNDWVVLLGQDADLDCLAVDHWAGGRFVLLVDSDDAPDGQLVTIHLADTARQQVGVVAHSAVAHQSAGGHMLLSASCSQRSACCFHLPSAV
jgi:hypothetical protein